MSLPLPSAVVKEIPASASPNLSLKFYKWADIYNHEIKKLEAEKKAEFLNSLSTLSKKPAYKKAFAIRMRMQEQMGGLVFNLTTATRLILGMGYEHPLENGFLFDWTTGLPIIPGSSLKGTARDLAQKRGNLPDEALFNVIFGNEKKKTAGDVIFMPAYPFDLDDNSAFFDQDVMTPHYGGYYANPQTVPPADWHSPNPIPFLTVPKGIKYRFRLINRNNWHDVSSPVITQARDILSATLKEEGVGAKTGVFYGYFE